MKDGNIRNNYLTKKKLDLLFVRANKHRSNMKFEVFLNLIAVIAKEKYYNLPESEGTVKLL